MKNLFLAASVFMVINLQAQSNYKCYHLEEYLWNPKTLVNDIKSEKEDLSVFKINSANKTIIQNFVDGGSQQMTIKSESTDVDKNSIVYEVVSPANGYTYYFKIITTSHQIEIIGLKNGNNTLLKKYSYKD